MVCFVFKVTVGGFEPLLQFAYTTKLLFTKENILHIRNSATILGFKNLDNSCFEFLIPKFFASTKNATPTPWKPKRCCKEKCYDKKKDTSNKDVDADTPKPTSDTTLDEEEQLRGATSKPLDHPQQSCDNAGPDMSTQADYSLLCKYRKFQMACLEASGPEMTSMSPAPTEDECPSTSAPCPSKEDAKASEEPTSSKYIPVTEGCDFLTLGSSKPLHSWDAKASSCGGETSGTSLGESAGLKKVKIEEGVEELMEAGGVTVEMKCILGDGKSHTPGNPSPTDPERELQGEGMRSSIEQEVAEHLAKGFWSEPCPSSTATKPSAAPLHWLAQLDLGINKQDCPFLQDLGAVGARVPDSEEPGRAQGSPYVSSQNSGEEDSDSLDTEGDSESYGSERACEVNSLTSSFFSFGCCLIGLPVVSVPALQREGSESMEPKRKF